MSGTKVLLVGDTSNRTNWGCRATSAALRTLVEEHATIVGAVDMLRLRERVPGRVPVTALDPPSPVAAARRQGRRARARVRRAVHPAATDLGPDDLERFADDLVAGRTHPHLTRAIQAADVVLVNGEGAILQDRSGGRLMLGIAYAARTRFDRRVAIVNHTADLRSGMLPVARRVYPVIDDIRVRELHSLREVDEVAGTVPHAFAADAAFSGPPPPPLPSRDRPRIVVGGSAAYHKAAVSPDALRAGFHELCTRLGALGTVVVTAASVPDDQVLQPVASSLGLTYHGLTTPTQEAADLLATADLYVGGRWHPAILASRGGTPVVAFSSNSRNKIQGLLELLDIDQPEVDALRMGEHVDALTALAAVRLAAPGRERTAARARELAASAADNVAILRSPAL